MFTRTLTTAAFLLVAGCVPDGPTEIKPIQKAPEKPQVTRSAQAGIAAYQRVSARVEPVAESVCRSIHMTAKRSFCDFQIKTLNDPSQPPNAFQSIGKDGRPNITFNINMLRTVKNDHELAFIMGHEAGHQIATHINQKTTNQVSGSILGGILVAVAGGDVQVGLDIGGALGGRAYSQNFELEADTIGTHIAERAGYNPEIGALSFNRTGGGGLLSTHPAGPRRQQTVKATSTKIKAARSVGKVAPIKW